MIYRTAPYSLEQQHEIQIFSSCQHEIKNNTLTCTPSDSDPFLHSESTLC